MRWSLVGVALLPVINALVSSQLQRSRSHACCSCPSRFGRCYIFCSYRADDDLTRDVPDGQIENSIPLSTYRPGEVVCEGDECMLMLDTVADGVVDAAIPLGDALPAQGMVQRTLAHPAFELASVISTLVLLYTFTIEYGSLTPSTQLLIDRSDLICSTFFVIEFIARWYAVGLRGRYLFQPLTVIDFLNVLPLLVSPGLPYLPGTPLALGAGPTVLGTPLAPLAPLRLLRALRILRLRRLLMPEEITKLARAVTGNAKAEVAESTRVALRLGFSALAIVIISAGFEWQFERGVNPGLATWTDGMRAPPPHDLPLCQHGSALPSALDALSCILLHHNTDYCRSGRHCASYAWWATHPRLRDGRRGYGHSSGAGRALKGPTA